LDCSRVFKYLFLLVTLIITVMIVFEGFSYYAARRSLDAELESRRIGSLEYLQVLARKHNELLTDYFETRCRQRDRLAIYHVANAGLSRAYSDAFGLKNKLVDYVEKEGDGKVNIDETRKAINKFDFVLTEERLKKDIKATNPADPQAFKDFMRVPLELAVQYRQLYDEHNAILGSDRPYPDVSDIRVLEAKLARIRADQAAVTGKLKEGWEELLSRYEVWTAALGGERDLALDAAIAQDDQQSTARLVELDCRKAFPEARAKAVPDSKATPVSLTESGSVGPEAGGFYRSALQSYFGLPSIAQTLFVTLFLGALGALTLNVLRLSRIGWWSLQTDPYWGEVLLSPLLGALAAFGIFLLGSTGLLLTSDFNGGQSQTPALSAYFIGLLGFVSGLLYDEAFGRVRRFGVGMFAEGAQASSRASLEDMALAQLLKGLQATLAAELVMTFGLGSRLAAEKEFTLIVPSDDAIGQMKLADWRGLNSTASRQKFETWLQKHHAVARVLLGDSKRPPETPIKLDDGSELEIRKEGDAWKIGNALVAHADQVWSTGVIQVVTGEPVASAPR
jgi:hypothetical protein